MKLIKTIIFASMLLLLASCDKEDKYRDIIYFTGTESSNVMKYAIEEATGLGFSVRASSKLETQAEINLKIDNSLIDEYNKRHGTNYLALDNGVTSLSPNKVVIEAGKYASDPVMLQISSIDGMTDEGKYIVPILIENVQNGFPVLASGRVMYMIINKSIITKALKAAPNYFSIPFADNTTEWDVENMTQFTMEMRMYVNGWQNYSPYITSLMGLEEHFLLRCGDVTIKKDQMQIAGVTPVTGSKSVPSDKWVHIAATFDGKEIVLYLDGEVYASKDALNLKAINLHGTTPGRSFYIGESGGAFGRTLNGYVSEARTWAKALTKAEIQDGMCAVSPQAPGLLGYWKFNELSFIDGKYVAPDLTGHGFHAISTRGNSTTFMEGVRCP